MSLMFPPRTSIRPDRIVLQIIPHATPILADVDAIGRPLLISGACRDSVEPSANRTVAG
jgi:hypothetical protein